MSARSVHKISLQTSYQLSVFNRQMADASMDVLQTVLTSPELKSITENTGMSQ